MRFNQKFIRQFSQKTNLQLHIEKSSEILTAIDNTWIYFSMDEIWSLIKEGQSNNSDRDGEVWG